MTQKKDFGMTEVYETFKRLADIGVTPDDLKVIRTRPNSALRVMLALRNELDNMWRLDTLGSLIYAAKIILDVSGHCVCLVDGVFRRVSVFAEVPDRVAGSGTAIKDDCRQSPIVTQDERRDGMEDVLLAMREKLLLQSIQVPGSFKNYQWFILTKKF